MGVLYLNHLSSFNESHAELAVMCSETCILAVSILIPKLWLLMRFSISDYHRYFKFNIIFVENIYHFVEATQDIENLNMFSFYTRII